MKAGCFLVTLIFCFEVISAQSHIQGRVVLAETGAPVPGSSIFINNTSKGTVAGADGRFRLEDVPAGKHELIISAVGYETVVYPFTDKQLPLQLKVEMLLKVKELENVTVEPYTEEGWDKWGNTFWENFIGHTENAARCRIRNKESIRFRYFRKSNRLIAFSDEALQIENKALGYTISYQLEDFEINFNDKSSFFMGYSLYNEDRKERNSWQRKRDKAYYGSLMHFMRSLYANNLAEQGFEVRRLQKIPNLEKQRVRKLYLFSQPVRPQEGIVVIGPSKAQSPDSSAYYQRILRQPDELDQYGYHLLTADSLIAKEEDGFKLLYFPDYLLVTYKKEMEDPAYLRWQSLGRGPAFQQSTLFLREQEPVWVERNGNYYNPRDMYFYGYWSWSDKIGDSLPLDYEPER